MDAMREAVLSAPLISDVYKHYRGENLPDDTSFLANTATEIFKIRTDLPRSSEVTQLRWLTMTRTEYRIGSAEVCLIIIRAAGGNAVREKGIGLHL